MQASAAEDPRLFASTCVLDPEARGTVKLRSSHPFDAPRVAPNFLGTPGDVQRLAACIKREREPLTKMPASFVFNETTPAALGAVNGAIPSLEDQARPPFVLHAFMIRFT